MSIPIPQARKRNVYLFQDNTTEKRDVELAELNWVEDNFSDVWNGLHDEYVARTEADQELDTLKEDRSNKLTSSDTYVSDNVHYATTATVDQRIADISPKQIEWATIDETTNEQLYEWYTDGKLVLCKYDGGSVARGIYRMTTCNSTSAHFDTIYTLSISGVPELYFFGYLCCRDNEWTNNVRQVNFTKLETTDSKLTSTSTWSSSDTKYPTTKAVENYVAEHAPEPLDLDVEAHDYQCRLWHNVNSSQNTAIGNTGQFPWVDDFTLSPLLQGRASNAISFANIDPDLTPNLGFNLGGIRDALYYIKNPVFIIKGLAKKYFPSGNHTGIDILKAASEDNVYIYGTSASSGNPTSGQEFIGGWYRLEPGADETGSKYTRVDNPVYLSFPSGDTYEAAWYTSSSVASLTLYDGTDETSTHSYSVNRCFALRSFKYNFSSYSGEIVLEQKFILTSGAEEAPWKNYIVDGFVVTSSYGPAGKYSYGSVISRNGIDSAIGTTSYKNWTGLLIANSPTFAWGNWITPGRSACAIKIVDNTSDVLSPTNRLAFGKSYAIVDTYDTVPSQNVSLQWKQGSSWRYWTKLDTSTGSTLYPWNDILTWNKSETASGYYAAPWHQFGSLLVDSDANPGGYFKRSDVTETCWSNNPGWYEFSGVEQFKQTGESSFSETELYNTSFWQTLVWNTGFLSFSIDPNTDPKYMGSTGRIRLKDLSQVRVFSSPAAYGASYTSSTARVHKTLFANATQGQKDGWKFVVNNKTYYAYPGLQTNGNSIKPVLVLHADDTEWQTSGEPSSEYPWNHFVFDCGYLLATSGRLGLINRSPYIDINAPYGYVWTLWSESSGSSIKSFWTTSVNILSLDVDRYNIVGKDSDSTGKYLAPGRYASYSAQYTKAAHPNHRQNISNVYSFNLPSVWSEDIIDTQTIYRSTGIDRYIGKPNHINHTAKEASTYYLDTVSDELVINEWDFSNGDSSMSTGPTKTTRRLTLGPEVEWATYGTTTLDQIAEWKNAGKLVLIKDSNCIGVLSSFGNGAAYHFMGFFDPGNQYLSPCVWAWTVTNTNTWSREQLRVESTNFKVKSTDTWASNDDKYPTTKAIDARIVAVLQSYGLIP